jgi:hypothetical protein
LGSGRLNAAVRQLFDDAAEKCMYAYNGYYPSIANHQQFLLHLLIGSILLVFMLVFGSALYAV